MLKFITILLGCLCCLAHGDDLDVIVAADSTVEQRGGAYARVIKADFTAIAPKLLTLIATRRSMIGVGYPTKEPWREERLKPEDRISYTLYQIWHACTNAAPEQFTYFPLFLDLLDHAPAGDARDLVIGALRARLDFGHHTHPITAKVLPRLDRLVRDDAYPLPLRRMLLEILFKYADPNDYLELAMALTREGPSFQQAEVFRSATPVNQAARLTPANRKKYLTHCYGLLHAINDGHSGGGYFLAGHIGDFVGVKPDAYGGDGSFKPNQRLPQYEGRGGLNDSFFQDTVNNALKWWEEHKAAYQ